MYGKDADRHRLHLRLPTLAHRTSRCGKTGRVNAAAGLHHRNSRVGRIAVTASVIGRSPVPANHVLGRKLDSIPFSPYHMLIIGVLGLIGFVEGYDLSML